ncbi:unnamed protein product [Chondrus crispus]|uniref:Uncharacterized protein n=1 Tax=Chondrus crispus TaxID=2769 RepID=R7Q9N8_CHOCR|nr:unnamed protein product [Chondrus crispus]CDF34195.1 unnamed protein product [Chondrus crispus]|eukprot:XP_005714014.1 unnamed protein product [Chondrus crispus]
MFYVGDISVGIYWPTCGEAKELGARVHRLVPVCETTTNKREIKGDDPGVRILVLQLLMSTAVNSSQTSGNESRDRKLHFLGKRWLATIT